MVVPRMRILFTLMPVAWANLGLAPAALMARPTLLRMNSHIKKQTAKKSSRAAVGI